MTLPVTLTGTSNASDAHLAEITNSSAVSVFNDDTSFIALTVLAQIGSKVVVTTTTGSAGSCSNLSLQVV